MKTKVWVVWDGYSDEVFSDYPEDCSIGAYVLLLTEDEAIKYLENLKRLMPEFEWDKCDIRQATLGVKDGD